MTEYERNITNTYLRATDSDIVSGRAWYTLAYRSAQQLAPNDVRIGAGVIAALSPQMNWKANLELAARVIRTKRFTGTFGKMTAIAKAIYRGTEPLAVIKGPKSRAFYQSIVSAGDTDAVTIDRHALAIALGRNATDAERAKLKGTYYNELAQAYRNVARQVGLRPSELQAVTWVTWRREKGVVD